MSTNNLIENNRAKYFNAAFFLLFISLLNRTRYNEVGTFLVCIRTTIHTYITIFTSEKEIRKFQVDFLSASVKYCHQCKFQRIASASDDEEFSFKASLQQLFPNSQRFLHLYFLSRFFAFIHKSQQVKRKRENKGCFCFWVKRQKNTHKHKQKMKRNVHRKISMCLSKENDIRREILVWKLWHKRKETQKNTCHCMH